MATSRGASRIVAAVLVAALVAVTAVFAVGPTAPAAADGNEAVGAPFAARSLTAGNSHTCALVHDGTVKCWGAGGNGRLGYGDTTTRGDGPGEMGDDLPPVALGTGRTATAITAGASHTCALLDNGTVKCWGFGGTGQLGYGDTSARGNEPGEMGDALPAVALGTSRTATAITAGDNHTCALLDNGTVKCWGNGDNGRLGYGNTFPRGAAPGQMGDDLPAVALGTSRTATTITAGDNHTCARLDNGTVKCWGNGGSGQLGYGDTTTRGDGPGQMGDALPAVALGTDRTATTITAGDIHTCARLDNGTIKCWGAGVNGQLGYGDTTTRGDGPGEMGDDLPAVALGTSRTATTITAGTAHTCALLDNGTVKCWGNGGSGRLGYGDTTTRGDGPGEMGDDLPAVDLGAAARTAASVSAGSAHTCAVLDNGTVKCWGNGANGRLGYGDTTTRGDGPGQMGDALPAVDLGTGRTAIAVTAGTAHTCALLDNGTVKCWGAGGSGRLGYGDLTSRGDGPGQMGDDLPAVALGTDRTATSVSAGSDHSCARLDNGRIKCWGLGTSGQLGYGDTTIRGDGPGEMGDSLPRVELVTGVRASTVTAGTSHTCARLTDGSLRCWGLGANGQLGLRASDTRGDGPGEMGPNLPAVDIGIGAPTGLDGTVIDTVNADAVPGAHIALLDTTDFALIAGTVADNNGDYQLAVAPGDYFAYLIDPANEHTAGFSTPFLVTVPADTIADQNLTMAPTRGSIAGTVIDDTIATPIAGAMVFSLTNGGAAETATIADNNGDYTLPGLRTGNHYVAFADPTGNHRSEFWPDSPNVPDATTLAVTAGGTTIADSELPTQNGTLTGANLTGTIVQTGTLAPLQNIVVLALHASDFRLARATTTNNAGQYTLDVQASVGYKLAFYDASGLHGFEWHDNQPNTGLGTATTVTAPAVTNNAMNLLVGTQTGTITDADTTDPIDGAWVFAIGPSGLAGGTTTAPDGTYTITNLAPGTYRTTIVDPNGGRTQQYFTDSPTFDGATPYNITAGTTTSDIDAALAFA